MFKRYLLALLCAVTLGAALAANAGLAQHEEGPQSSAFAAFYAEVGPARAMVLDGNYSDARSILAPLIADNPVAQNLMGIILEHDSGDGASLRPALEMYALSAAQGYGKAFYNIALLHQDGGVDVPVDPVKAVAAYRDGALAGYGPAHEEWVWNLMWGDAAVQDHTLAFEQGQVGIAAYPDSTRLKTLLGDAHYFAMGTPEDLSAALGLYEDAAALGDAFGQFSAGYQHFYGEGTAEDDAKALAYFEQAAAQDYGLAFGYLASIYIGGYGVEPDYALGLEYARQGRGRDDGMANSYVGDVYRAGLGVDVDYDQALIAYRAAASQGHIYARRMIAEMTLNGEGVVADPSEAYAMYRSVLEDDPDNIDAKYEVGFMLMRGEGVEVDIAAAIPLIDAAHVGGSIGALFEMPVLYAHPNYSGSHQDDIRAFAGCLELEDGSHEIDPVRKDETLTVCTRLADSLTADQQDQARAMMQ